jgi:glycerate 2-kinase
VTVEGAIAGPDDSRRRLLLDLFQAGLVRVDGRLCVARTLGGAAGLSSTRVWGGDPAARDERPTWVAAVGKAASAMALGACDALQSSIQRVLLITKDGHVSAQARSLPGVEVYESAHPVPDARSLEAGARLLRWVDELPADVQPLFLISGGSSSLVEVLEEGVSFADLARINAQGLAAGVPIGELNARRARLSQIKGGRLAARLAGRKARALFISDVPGDDPGVIGSGLLGPARRSEDDGVQRMIVASIGSAVEAVRSAAAGRGLKVNPSGPRFDDDAARLAIRFAHELHLNLAQVCVWGGESTLELPSSPGRGGRNQHLALATARLIAGQPNLALLAAGTDGTDGPTEDAGGIVDGGTVGRILLGGLDADRCLAHADSNAALAAAGDLLHTGPTGTNVGDLVIGLNLPRVL